MEKGMKIQREKESEGTEIERDTKERYRGGSEGEEKLTSVIVVFFPHLNLPRD